VGPSFCPGLEGSLPEPAALVECGGCHEQIETAVHARVRIERLLPSGGVPAETLCLKCWVLIMSAAAVVLLEHEK
jgi:hypothetical protein